MKGSKYNILAVTSLGGLAVRCEFQHPDHCAA